MASPPSAVEAVVAAGTGVAAAAARGGGAGGAAADGRCRRLEVFLGYDPVQHAWRLTPVRGALPNETPRLIVGDPVAEREAPADLKKCGITLDESTLSTSIEQLFMEAQINGAKQHVKNMQAEVERRCKEAETWEKMSAKKWGELARVKIELAKREQEVNLAQAHTKREIADVLRQQGELKEKEEALKKDRAELREERVSLVKEKELLEEQRTALTSETQQVRREQELEERLGKLSAELDERSAAVTGQEARLAEAQKQAQAASADFALQQERLKRAAAEQKATENKLKAESARLRNLQESLSKREAALASERASREKVEQDPRKIVKHLWEQRETASASRPSFLHAEERVFSDAKDLQLRDGVLKEQFHQLSMTLGEKQKSGSSQPAAASAGASASASLAAAPLEASMQSLVLAMLAMGGATGSGSKATPPDLDDFAAKLFKVCEHLGRQHKNNTALAFALTTSGVCSLQWSTVRKRGKHKAVLGQLHDLHRWLQADVTDLKELGAHWKKHCKSDCLKQATKALEESLKAWALLESYFYLQRQFMKQLCHRASSDDLRLLLFTMLCPAGAASWRELAAAVKEACHGRHGTATAAGASPPAAAAAAAERGTPPAAKRPRAS